MDGLPRPPVWTRQSPPVLGARPAMPNRLATAFRVQMIVLGAIMMREIHTRFGRHHMGYLWLFFEPMILGGCIAVVHYVSGHGLPGGLDILSFYIVGYTPYYLFRSILNRAATSLLSNAPLFYHRQVTFLDVMIARNILDCAAVMMAVLIMLGLIGATLDVWPVNLVQIAFGIFLIAVFCHGIALIIVAATMWGVETVDRVVHPLTYLSIPLTGAFYMVWWFPISMQEWMLLIPSVHMFEIIREGQFGPVVPYNYDVVFMLASCAVTNLLGMLALSAAKRRIEFI